MFDMFFSLAVGKFVNKFHGLIKKRTYKKFDCLARRLVFCNHTHTKIQYKISKSDFGLKLYTLSRTCVIYNIYFSTQIHTYKYSRHLPVYIR